MSTAPRLVNDDRLTSPRDMRDELADQVQQMAAEKALTNRLFVAARKLVDHGRRLLTWCGRRNPFAARLF
jgi:hypothetical protein